jgi:methionyl-tRNA synthetase
MRFLSNWIISSFSTVPHIGHLHSLVTADILARFHRLTHPQQPVHFLTGTDEHGLKIQKAAREQGLGEKEFCDGISERFRVSSFSYSGTM